MDFNARFYDPWIGRFMQVDPLVDIQESWTPYHFSYNNPVALNDPSGLFPEDTSGEEDESEESRLERIGQQKEIGLQMFYDAISGDGDQNNDQENVSQNDNQETDGPNITSLSKNNDQDLTYSYGGVDGLTKTELYGLILIDKTIEQFGIKDIFALTGVIAGQPLLKKRFVTPGSSSGTSPLSKFLSNRMGTSPVRLPTLVANKGRIGIAMTKSIGKFTSRAVPFIGWGILAYDAGMILYNTQVEFNRITDSNSK